jgi:uncharacterized membrane protein
MSAEMIVLRLVHILCGIFWVGSAAFSSFFLLPALAGAGPAAGQIMAGLQRRRLFVVLPVAALLTIVSGLRLMSITSAGFQGAYFASASGRTFAASAVAATIGFLIGMFVARPAATRAGTLGAQLGAAQDEGARGALLAQLEQARARSATANLIALVVLILSAAGMAVGRYLG